MLAIIEAHKAARAERARPRYPGQDARVREIYARAREMSEEIHLGEVRAEVLAEREQERGREFLNKSERMQNALKRRALSQETQKALQAWICVRIREKQRAIASKIRPKPPEAKAKAARYSLNAAGQRGNPLSARPQQYFGFTLEGVWDCRLALFGLSGGHWFIPTLRAEDSGPSGKEGDRSGMPAFWSWARGCAGKINQGGPGV